MWHLKQDLNRNTTSWLANIDVGNPTYPTLDVELQPIKDTEMEN